MAGSTKNPRRWVRIIQSNGTTSVVFQDSVNHICTDIENAPIMGCQDAHTNNVVTNTDLRWTSCGTNCHPTTLPM